MSTRRPVSDGPGSLPEFDLPEGISTLGRDIEATGEIRAAEHLIIEGTFDGRIFIPDHDVAIGRSGKLSGELLARHITVRGRVTGRLVAGRVEIEKGATVVDAEVLAERLVIADGAFFQGTVDPARTDAAFAVFRHERSKRR